MVRVCCSHSVSEAEIYSLGQWYMRSDTKVFVLGDVDFKVFYEAC